MSETRKAALRVIVVTPLGQGGKGGIDRVMDQLRAVANENDTVSVRFVTSRGPHILTSPFYLIGAGLHILTAKLSGQVDVVHLNLASNASTARKRLLAGLCRLIGVAYVIHLHGALFHTFWQGLLPQRQAQVDDLFRRAGAVILLGGIWRDLVTSRVPESAPRLFIVPNATAPRPKAQGSPQEPVIVFLGQVGERKGAPDLLRALAALPEDTHWRAILAGDGAVSEMRKLTDELGLGERVELPGWVGPEDVDRLLAGADILSLPSYNENLPMSVIEGMAAGLAIVTTPVGATPDIIESERNGLLVEPGNIAGLTAALAKLLGDEALRHRLGEAARADHRKTLSLDVYSERLMPAWKMALRAELDLEEMTSVDGL